MATVHGRKHYFQILLDPNRAALIESEARKAGQRPTAWIRDALYNVLEKRLPSSVYEDAVQKDYDAWRGSVQRRVEGRTKNKETEKQSSQDAA